MAKEFLASIDKKRNLKARFHWDSESTHKQTSRRTKCCVSDSFFFFFFFATHSCWVHDSVSPTHSAQPHSQGWRCCSSSMLHIFKLVWLTSTEKSRCNQSGELNIYFIVIHAPNVFKY